MSAVSAFPLAWPPGWKRTAAGERRSARFNRTERQYSSAPGGGSWNSKRAMTIAEAFRRLMRELTRFGVPPDDVVLSTNLELRLDGLPRSKQRAPDDPGAAVYWRDGGERRCMAIDVYTTVEDNIAALAATIEAMRAIERHGGAVVLDRAFMGFAALPAPGQTTARGWREVLGVGPTASYDEAKSAYRALASKNHPDRGGDAAKMTELNWAMGQANAAYEGAIHA